MNTHYLLHGVFIETFSHLFQNQQAQFWNSWLGFPRCENLHIGVNENNNYYIAINGMKIERNNLSKVVYGLSTKTVCVVYCIRRIPTHSKSGFISFDSILESNREIRNEWTHTHNPIMHIFLFLLRLIDKFSVCYCHA